MAGFLLLAVGLKQMNLHSDFIDHLVFNAGCRLHSYLLRLP
jgi:hypothetical protein